MSKESRGIKERIARDKSLRDREDALETAAESRRSKERVTRYVDNRRVYIDKAVFMDDPSRKEDGDGY